MGGIFTALFTIGKVAVAFLSENIFYSKIIKDVYQTRRPGNNIS